MDQINSAAVLSGLKGIPPNSSPEFFCSGGGGVTAMTRQIAAEYAPHAIRANAIAPGRTLTPRLRAMLKTEWGMSERARKVGDMHLLGQRGKRGGAALRC